MLINEPSDWNKNTNNGILYTFYCLEFGVIIKTQVHTLVSIENRSNIFQQFKNKRNLFESVVEYILWAITMKLKCFSNIFFVCVVVEILHIFVSAYTLATLNKNNVKIPYKIHSNGHTYLQCNIIISAFSWVNWSGNTLFRLQFDRNLNIISIDQNVVESRHILCWNGFAVNFIKSPLNSHWIWWR